MSAPAHAPTSRAPRLRLHEQTLETVGGQTAHEPGHDHTVGVDKERLGDSAHAVIECHPTIGVRKDRPVAAIRLEEAAHTGDLVVVDHHEHTRVRLPDVALSELDELGVLTPARDAPGREE